MTLQEALTGYEWIPDPWDENVARVGGPDNQASIIVKSADDGSFGCWLRCSKSGNRLSNVLHVNRVDEVSSVVGELYCLREKVRNCLVCGAAMATDGREASCSTCGHVEQVGQIVMEMQEMTV